MIAAAARALAAGDALGALKRSALRDDPAALALRRIAMAQLEDFARARELLKRAARAFGVHEELCDRANATHAPLVGVRRLLLLRRVDEAAAALAAVVARQLPAGAALRRCVKIDG